LHIALAIAPALEGRHCQQAESKNPHKTLGGGVLPAD
jgi:hypothetical protein